MALPGRLSPNFPYPVLPHELCGIINDYAACTAEARAAFCLHSSQSKESLSKAERQAMRNIWQAFVQEVNPKNSVLEDWVEKHSFTNNTEFKKSLYSLQHRMESYIKSKMGPVGIEKVHSIQSQFVNRKLNFFRLEALTYQMNAAAEFDALKKIITCIGEEISPEHKEEAAALDSEEAIKRWIEENHLKIEEIESLDLFEKDLSVIPETFLRIQMPNLKTINLSSNNLKTLPAGFGSNWSSLRVIKLSCNRLSSLPSDFGTAWGRLKEIELDQNELIVLPDQFGDAWTEINQIWISDNRLQSLPNNFGRSWPSLHQIWLNQNELQTLPDNFGDCWPLLSELELSHNKFQSLPSNFGSSWGQLLVICLDENRLQSLPAYFGYAWALLTSIELSANQLPFLPDDFGSAWPKLQGIWLAENGLISLPTNFGLVWDELYAIGLFQNQIQNLQERFGENWRELSSINLGHNKLQSLPAHFGSRWTDLVEIDLAQNMLQTLPQDFGDNWTSLKEITLINNPALKQKSAHFGRNWRKGVSINTDSWFNTEAEEMKCTEFEAPLSRDSYPSGSISEEKNSTDQSLQHASYEKSAGAKRALEHSPGTEEQSPKKVKNLSSLSSMEDLP